MFPWGKGTSSGRTYAEFAAQERERASLEDDLDREFTLPITHQVVENLDTSRMQVVTMDTRIPPSNIGHRLLLKMGWGGGGLGRRGDGIREPIRVDLKGERLGLGKCREDDWYTAEENITRKRLDVEVEESEEQAKKRMERSERQQKVQEEVKSIVRAFYCELCNKQYKLAVEHEAHLSSYDHHHAKRMKESKEMAAAQRGGDAAREERARREAMREQKELERRVAAVAAITPVASTTTQVVVGKGELQMPGGPVLPSPSAIDLGKKGEPVKFGFGGMGPGAGAKKGVVKVGGVGTKPGGVGGVKGAGTAKGRPGIHAAFGGDDDDE
eukprot:jgi/Mesvir1/10282/Mv07826-RA.1